MIKGKLLINWRLNYKVWVKKEVFLVYVNFFFFDNVLYSRIDIIKEVLCENDSFFKYMVNFD